MVVVPLLCLLAMWAAGMVEILALVDYYPTWKMNMQIHLIARMEWRSCTWDGLAGRRQPPFPEESVEKEIFG